ncbi:MAG: HypC/HybG/HupF family hydrogenase formation chaperone [Burkholderiaceae bacterium]|nr:HypC/HybG/HupF family hydrogenase formation chaperone [Burkholderiaceae bacterium]
MCIGIPMKVTQILNESSAFCESKDQKGLLNTLLIGSVSVGDWVLAWNGYATQKLTEERAHSVTNALEALTDANEGRLPDIESSFADIIENTGKLPKHLEAQVKGRK